LEHFLALEKGFKLGLRIFKFSLRAREFVDRLIAVTAGPIVEDLGRKPRLLFTAMRLLEGGHRIQGGLQRTPSWPIQEAGSLKATHGALQGPALLLEFIGPLAMGGSGC
jgi:hypothetical protein